MENFARGHEIHRRTADQLERYGARYNTSRNPDFRFGRGVGVELKPLGRCRQINCVEYRWR